MQFKWAIFAGLLAAATPALTQTPVVTNGLREVTQKIIQATNMAESINSIPSPEFQGSMRELINIHNAIVQYLPPVVPTDEQSQVCNAWLTYATVEKQLLYTIIGKESALTVPQFRSEMIVTLRSLEGATDQYTDDLFGLASSCSEGLADSYNDLYNAFDEAINAYR